MRAPAAAAAGLRPRRARRSTARAPPRSARPAARAVRTAPAARSGARGRRRGRRARRPSAPRRRSRLPPPAPPASPACRRAPPARRGERELQLDDDAEAGAAPAQRPEQIGMLVRARYELFSRSRDDARRKQRIRREAELALQPPRAGSEREPGDADRGMRAPVTARTCACVAASITRQVAPPCTHRRRAAGSTWTPSMWVRSIVSAPSATAKPAGKCPPPRTVTAMPRLPACRSAAATSRGPSQHAISAGRRSTAALLTWRASS